MARTVRMLCSRSSTNSVRWKLLRPSEERIRRRCVDLLPGWMTAFDMKGRIPNARSSLRAVPSAGLADATATRTPNSCMICNVAATSGYRESVRSSRLRRTELSEICTKSLKDSQLPFHNVESRSTTTASTPLE
eukprot:scaffold48836_cov32-Tisochrysis_lutea.AAC.4